MARAFLRASSEYLTASSAVVSSFPMTVSIRFYRTDDLNSGLFSICDLDADNNYVYLTHLGGATDRIRLQFNPEGSGGTYSFIESTTNTSVNTWHHACVVCASTISRSIYLDGGGKATDTTDVELFPLSLDNTSLGALIRLSPTGYMQGYLAEAAVWNADLTDTEVAILATGLSPLAVRPQSLVFYVPLVRDNDEDIVGGLSLSSGGTPTIAVHPSVRYPVSPQSIHMPAGIHYVSPFPSFRRP